ncbi:MAG: cyclic nucleotide-binding domain-containing protein, partial [Hyphomicrobiales bacterium]|nr:cyclic nucleotide-binding domain-containing protein [Hyphomicrobiales bacterium]
MTRAENAITEPTRSLQQHGREPSLSSIPTLSDVDPDGLERLEASTTVRTVRRGTVLIRQSDPPDKLYLVLSGRFVVLLDDKKEAIAEIGPGEPLGELAFFAGVKRTANVVAARDSKVMVLSKEDYAR